VIFKRTVVILTKELAICLDPGPCGAGKVMVRKENCERSLPEPPPWGIISSGIIAIGNAWQGRLFIQGVLLQDPDTHRVKCRY
jgi:hypothetical protein